MTTTLHAVRGLVPGKRDRTNLRSLSEAVSFCLDQRAFGPRRLLVAFANGNGRFRGLAYTRRTDPPETALAGCIEYLGRRAKAAIAFCDEPVAWGPPPDDLAERFGLARSIAASYGVHLVDWFALRRRRVPQQPVRAGSRSGMVGCDLTRCR